MTKDDRLSRKLKDEENTKLKKKNASPASISGSADTSGLRRSGRETSSSTKQATASPSNARKSERIEKQASPSPPLSKKKSENIVKQMAESPLRRSDRGKKHLSPGSSASKKLAKIPASSNIKSKKEKIPSSPKESVGDASEDNKDERQDPDVGGRKRKRMTARGYKALFKPQRLRVEADDDQDPNGQEKSPQANTSSNGGTTITVKKHDDVETGPCLKETRINHGLEDQQELDPCDNTGEGDLCGTSSSKTVKLNESSTMPYKLLKRRLLLSFKPQNESQEDPGKVLDYHHEWLVERQGLDYGQATWELESAILGSPEGQHLIKEYDHGHGKMEISAPMVDKTKEASVKPPASPAGGPPGMDQIHFSYVKKLQDGWTKGQNRVLFDNQERVMRVVLFVLSLNGVTHPFLILTTSGYLAQWEAMFLRVAPSNDFKVSIEVRETQKSVRLLEVQKEGGELVFQVLLYCVDAFVEDLSMLKNINWEAIMVDESQCSEISAHFNDIKSLSTNKRLLLFGGPIGESMAEYLNVLSLLDTRSKTESDDTLGKLKETLSQYVAYDCKPDSSKYVAYDCKPDSSKFVEFWVPVQLSNVQLEQYCVTLFSNAMVLRSCSKSDTKGAFHDILISNRKCCNHPYIVDPNLQGVIMKDREPTMLMDVGIKASGKLQFLDLILPEVKKHQLRVVILFQPTVGTAKGLASVGDILDDFLHYRFGQDSYERIDGVGIVPSKKQAALNNFNKDMNRFVFLLEHRACQASIKLSSVDIIVIFDSDLNPAYDLKALQKISIDSQSEQIMIFRLYSSSTLEEKILRMAEQSVAIDSKLQNLNRSSCDSLLMFGVSDLLNKLTQFHNESLLNISSEESFLKDVLEEFLYIISHKCNSKDTSKSIITRVQSCGIYGKNIPLHSPLPFGEQPHLFWRKLLEGKFPKWKFVSVSTPRQRKRPHYFEDSAKETNATHADVGKRRKKTLNNSIDPPAFKPVIEAETGGTNEGASVVPPHNESQSSSGDHFWSTAVIDERSLHNLLKPTVSELCDVLKFPEDVKMTVERFLDFVLANYHVSKEHTSTLQAFMISLCWIASSLSRYKIDRKESFALAKKHLNFSCMEEEANSVYLKLEPAKEMFISHTESTEPKTSHSLPLTQGVKHEIVHGQLDQNADVSGSHELSNEEMLQSTEKMGNECKEDLAKKNQKEIEMFNREWDEKRMVLENDHKVEKALIRTLHSNLSVRSEKLKVLEKEFANKLEEVDRMREIQLKDLMAKLLADEDKITADCNESQHENLMVQSGNSIQEARDVPEVDPTSATSVPTGEIPAQRLNGIDNNVVGTVDSVESGMPEADSNEENAKENAKDHHETGPDDMQPHADSAEMGTPAGNCNKDNGKDNGEDNIIIPDTSHVEAQNDSCGSSSSNLPSAAVSPDKTPTVELVASPSSDHLMPTIPEIQIESLQLEQLPCSGNQDKEGQADPSSLAEIDVDNLQQVDGGQVGQINSEDPSLEPHDEPSFPLSPNLPIAENQSDIPPASGLLLESTHEDTLPEGPSQPAENHTNPSDHTLLQSSGNLEENQPLSDAVHDQPSDEPDSSGQNPEQPSAEPDSSAQNLEPPAPPVAEIQNQNASQPEMNMFDVHGSDNHNQVVSRITNQVDPLQAELERLCAVKDNVIKYHEDIRQRLKSDCEKEIAEMIAQINAKYEAKRQDAEVAFHSKKKELDVNLNRVVMNKILAEAFRAKCQDFTPGNGGTQHATQAGLMQQLHRFSVLPTVRRSFGVGSSSPGQSVGTQPITPLPPLPPPPPPLVPPPPPPPQPPLQIVHQPAALFSTTLTRPPLTSSGPLIPSTTPSRTPPSPTSDQITPSSSLSRPPPGINPITPSSTLSRPPSGINPIAPSSTLSRPLPGINPITPLSTLSRPPSGINPISPLNTTNRPPPSINQITASAVNLRINTETRAPAPHIRPLVSSEIRSPAPHMRPLSSSEIRAPAPHIRPFRPSTSPSHDFSSYRKMPLTSNSQMTSLPEDSTVPPQRPPSASSPWLPSRSQSPQPRQASPQSTPSPSLYPHNPLSRSSSLPRIPTSQTGIFSASPRSQPLDNFSRLPPPTSELHMDIDLMDLTDLTRDFGASGHDLVCLSDDD